MPQPPFFFRRSTFLREVQPLRGPAQRSAQNVSVNCSISTTPAPTFPKRLNRRIKSNAHNPIDITRLLLHFDGTNGSTTFTDSSPSPVTFSVVSGTPTLTTGQLKFGTAALSLPGSSYISTPGGGSVKWDPGSSDFTLEFWLRHTNTDIAVNRTYVTCGAAGFYSFYLAHLAGGGGTWEFASRDSVGNSWEAQSTGNAISAGQWYHFAFERAGTALRGYIDGVMQTKITVSGSIRPCAEDLIIGALDGGTEPHDGQIDELRMSFTALYNSDDGFTPPAAAFTLGDTIATVVKQTGKPLSISNTPTMTVLRPLGKLIAAATTATFSVVKQTSKRIISSSTPTMTLLKQTGKLISIGTTATFSVVKQTGKLISIGTTATFSVVKQTGKRIVSSTTATFSVLKQAGKLISAATTPTISLIKQTGKVIRATTTPAIAVLKQAGKFISLGTTATFNVVKQTGKVIRATTTAAFSVITNYLPGSATFNKTISAVVTPAFSVVRSIGKLINAPSNTIASLSVTKALLRTITASVATTQSVIKSIVRTINTTTTPVVLVAKGIGKIITAFVSAAVSLARVYTPKIEAEPNSVSTVELTSDRFVVDVPTRATINLAPETELEIPTRTRIIIDVPARRIITIAESEIEVALPSRSTTGG